MYGNVRRAASTRILPQPEAELLSHLPQTEDLAAVVSALDECRVVREIGRDGMGAVFLAEERSLQRMVALAEGSMKEPDLVEWLRPRLTRLTL